jgi:capsular polysaccharide transport system permease protein
MNDTQGAGGGRPDDKGAGLRRPKVSGRRITALLAEVHDVDIAPDLDPGASQSRPVAPQPDSNALPPHTDDAQTIGPALKSFLTLPRFAFLQDALPRVKASPLLVSFVAVVLVPAFAALVYFALIASDQFAAQARFAVRQIDIGSSDSMATAENSASGSTDVNFSFTAPGQNAYIVTSYIQSRAIVDDLNETLNLREIFRRPEADFWARLQRNASIDELTDYWKSMVGTYIDAPSGIVTLNVRAFRPDDAVALAKAVLTLSEALVNRISDRARRDAMESSEEEVRRTFAMTQSALADLRQFRDSSGIIDPVQAGTDIGKLLLPLLTEKIRLESDLFVASRDLDKTAPTIIAMKSQLDATEKQIADLRGKLTNTDGDNKTLAASLAKFEQLDLKRQFAEKLYTLAQADLDRARLRAERQSVYLTVFVPPSPPEESRYPRRIAFPILIFLGLGIVWSIGAMVVASVEDHRL